MGVVYNEDKHNKKPSIKVIELNTTSEDDVIAAISNYPNAAFIVTLRAKYSGESEWEYISDSCVSYSGFIEWMTDWNEGQQDVEYLYLVVVE